MTNKNINFNPNFYYEKFSNKYLWLILLLSWVLMTSFSLFSINTTLKWWFLPPADATQEVVVVAIDDRALQKYGSWPWEREVYQEITEKILSGSPKKVGLDIIFQEKPNDPANAEFNKLLVENKVVVGDTPSNLEQIQTDRVLTKGVEKASVMVKLGSGGKIYDYSYFQNGKKSLALALSGKIDGYPYSTILNPRKAYPKTVYLTDLMESPELVSVLKDKHVLVGSHSTNLSDFYYLNGGDQIPGVYIHALALGQLLDNQIYQSPVYPEFFDYVIVTLYSILLAVIAKWSKLRNRLMVNAVIPILITILIFVGVDLNPSLIITIFICTILISALWIWDGFVFEKRRIYEVLKAHLSPAVMQQVLNNPKIVDLGGQKYDATVMFTDIRGFTKMSESMDPKMIGEVLNELLGLQAETVLKHDGVVDKFIGDSVMALWGAPIRINNHAYKSLICALDLRDGLEKFNENNHFGLKINVGIGLNSGSVAVGNYGSKSRFNYTAVGDTVNAASRIESLNKEFETQILFSQHLLDSLSEKEKSRFEYRLIKEVKLRGRSEDLNIYQLIGLKN